MPDFFCLGEDYSDGMAIYHDAYLFSPDDFAYFIQENASNKVNTWDKLIEQCRLFSENSSVLALADTYGGWDYESIAQELDEEKEDKPYLAQFIFMIFLYKYLGTIQTSIEGFGHHWHKIEDSNLLSEDDKQLLIYGHSFASFIRNYQIEETTFSKYLQNDINPFSTGGRAGYLSQTDVNMLQEKVQAIGLEQKSSDVTKHFAFAKAKEMLDLAIKAKMGLCLIISG